MGEEQKHNIFGAVISGWMLPPFLCRDISYKIKVSGGENDERTYQTLVSKRCKIF